MSTYAKALTCLLAMGQLPIAAQPTNRSAHDVMRLLTDVGTRDTILLGQNFGHGNDRPQFGYRRFIETLASKTGKVPSIASLDYGYDEIPSLLHASNAPLIEHWQAGGLVMICMHPANPWTGGTVNDVGHGEFDDLFQEGTAVQTVWSAEMDRVARGLHELQEAGVVVLFRPFHEMNGGWFWWAAKHRGQWLPKAQFIKLWRQTHEFLTHEKALSNLLWVYSPTVSYDHSQKSPMHYYPGDDVVDVVALDWYTDKPKWSDVSSNYEALAATGKPVGIAEFGPGDPQYGKFDNMQMLEFLDESARTWAFISYWHSWNTGRVAIVDHPHAMELMQHDRIIDRAALKQMIELPSQSAQSMP